MTEQQHPLTDEIIDEIIDEFAPDEWIFDWTYDLMRAAYDMGYTEGLEDAQDIITCLQRKNSPSKPVTLEELATMQPQVVDLPHHLILMFVVKKVLSLQRTIDENGELMRPYDL